MNYTDVIKNVQIYGLKESIKASKYPMAIDVDKCTPAITDRTKSLGSVITGTGHDTFLHGIIVQFDWTFTPKCSVEAERYHFLDFVSSQSTMHRITKFNLNKAYIEYVDSSVIEIMKEKVLKYNELSKEEQNSSEGKKLYLEILYTNPCGMFLTARMTTNYQQLKTIYQQRRSHRLPEWQWFCDWIETLPSFKELCLNKNNN